MGDELHGIRAALPAIPETELAALQATADESPQFAPGLFAFLSHACDWELGRRHGRAFLLNGPHAAIPPEEMGASFSTLAVLLASFGAGSSVGSLLGAVGDALDGDLPAVH